jgi:hypothetical protein
VWWADWGPADLDLRAEEFDFLRAESVIKHFCGGRYGPSNSQKPTKRYEAASLGGLLPSNILPGTRLFDLDSVAPLL